MGAIRWKEMESCSSPGERLDSSAGIVLAKMKSAVSRALGWRKNHSTRSLMGPLSGNRSCGGEISWGEGEDATKVFVLGGEADVSSN